MEMEMEFVDVRIGELDAQGIAVLISLKKISRVLHAPSHQTAFHFFFAGYQTAFH
jgi:hypothetical protein